MLRIGERVGVWTVDHQVGESSVFRCHNPEAPGMRVSLKALDPLAPGWLRLRERLLRDMESWLILDHPGLPHFRMFSPWGPIPYVEQSWVEGPTLWEEAGGTAVEAAQVVTWLTDAARAVAAMHARGLRHGDIKLENLRLREGALTLVDFGTTATPELLSPRAWPYAPPELGDLRSADSAGGDLYALGVCAWELLRGMRAFRSGAGRSLAELADYKRALGPLDPGPRVPVELRMLIRELSHPNVGRRTRSATQLLESLSGLDLETTDPTLQLDGQDAPSGRRGPSEGATWFPPEEEDSTEDELAPSPSSPDDAPAPAPDPRAPPPERSRITLVPMEPAAPRTDPRPLLAGLAALALIALIAAILLVFG